MCVCICLYKFYVPRGILNFFVATPDVYIVYTKEDSYKVLQLSKFLRTIGISCDIDQYHSSEDITDWGHWNEDKIKQCCSSNGFILLICSEIMYHHLCVSETSTIEMHWGCISNLSLRTTITDKNLTQRVIPVFLEECRKEYLHSCLIARSSYSISISQWMDTSDVNLILNTPGLEQLRSLTYRLFGQPEIEKPTLS